MTRFRWLGHRLRWTSTPSSVGSGRCSRALDPDQVNALSGQLIQAFEGQGATIGSFLTQTAALTNTLADRDQLIGDVIVNLNSVLGSLGGQSDQFSKAVDSLVRTGEGSRGPQDRHQ